MDILQGSGYGSPITNTTTVILGLLVFVVLVAISSRSRRRLKLPPGPAGWPIIGNLPVLFRDLQSSTDDFFFSKCARKYGDIYKVKLGRQMMYVLSNVDKAREVFTNTKVQGRVPGVAYEMAIGRGAFALVFISGPAWGTIRKFTKILFRNLGVGKDVFADNIRMEVDRFADKLDSFTGVTCWELYDHFYVATSNAMCGIAFGHQYDYEDPGLKQVLRLTKAYMEGLGPSGMVMSSRLLCMLPFGPGKKLIDCLVEFKQYVREIIRIKSRQAPEALQESPNSYVKSFMEKMKEGDQYFDENNLIACSLELFSAGTETTASTITWAILCLMTFPSVQVECQEELDRVINEHGVPSYSDRSKLPYLQAVILETERFAAVANLGVPHRVEEDMHLFGYDFPKGTVVAINFDCMNKDKERYSEPDKFKPDRFIRDGQFEADPDIIPFSVGRRACPGEQLARMEIFMFLTSLLHKFSFAFPEGCEGPGLNQAVYGIARMPPPFPVVITRRENVE